MDIKRFELSPEEIADATVNYLCPSREYDNAISQRTVAKVLSRFEPVELEALGDEEIDEVRFQSYFSRGYPLNATETSIDDLVKKSSSATVKHNQSKGQLFRLKEGQGE